MTVKKRAKGIGLLSGGLDSILAVKVLQEQDLELMGVTFVTPFFDAEPGLRAGQLAGIPMRALDIGEEHLRMLRNPRYGYGRAMNPCIDCHALMLRVAGRLMEAEDADFLFTGEVVGQRPMSQRRDALRSVETLSGYPGRILRPLSAKLLPPTLVEQAGLVDREKLLDLHGRGRKGQMELAARYGIREIPQPGGGCMLTKEGFSRKLRELLASRADADPVDVERIKRGRLFRLPHGALLVVGRSRSDNARLEALLDDATPALKAANHPGPLGVLLAADPEPKDLKVAAMILAAYSDAPEKERAAVTVRCGAVEKEISAPKRDRERFRRFMIQ